MAAAPTVRGLRGATTVDEDTVAQVTERSQELMRELMTKNDLVEDDIISVLFPSTAPKGSAMTSRAEVGERRRALVVGTGLIGGSIALGLRQRGWHVSGLDVDEERLRAALQAQVIDVAGDDPRAEVVFIAVPAAAVGAVARGLLDDD